MNDTDALLPTSLTSQAAEFVAGFTFEKVSPEALRIARRCILDGIGVMLAGTDQPAVKVIDNLLTEVGGAAQARLIGGEARVPASLAALRNGVAGHVMDWDDTQLAEGPDRVFGLMTHPTIPVLASALATADLIGGVDGAQFVTGFIAGVEVECKLALAIDPSHYLDGFHTSGTIGTFGATIASAKLLGLSTTEIRRAIGVAASMASGMRVNFGTMTKPLHVGRAAENGLTAALLVKKGLTASEIALDGRWGYLSVAGGARTDPGLALGRFGEPLSIVSPGVSIKPYPCGVLTHPTMDAMRDVMEEHDLKHDEIASVTVLGGRNILEPIRYLVAHTELEAKFCLPFLLTAIMIRGKAGKAEFSHEFVASERAQQTQMKVQLIRDHEIEKQGFDRIRSRLVVETTDGREFIRNVDGHYRGSPKNPLSDAELEAKFIECVDGMLDERQIEDVVAFISTLESQEDATKVLALVEPSRGDSSADTLTSVSSPT